MSCLHMSSDCIFGIHGDFMPFLKRLYACGSSRVSFAIDCLGSMSDSFEPNLVEGMEELYFGADQVSIPESDDSSGRAQYYVESYVYEYEPEEPLNAPGLGETLRRPVQRIPQLRCRYFQDVSSQLQALVFIHLDATMGSELKSRRSQ